MKVTGVIPARWGSTRFPGKPLHLIHGKPLLQWVIEGAKTAKTLSEVIVATDHQEIFKLAQNCGVKAVMTPSELATGSDRVEFAMRERDADIVLNIQGDEPLLKGAMLDRLAQPLLEDKNIVMATLGRKLSSTDCSNPSTAKVILNEKSDGIYFSRLAIPFSRQAFRESTSCVLKHIGLYAFRRDFLRKFCQQPPTELEMAEGLEQLRALWLGARIRVIPVEYDSIGVDTPEDVGRVEAQLTRIDKSGQK